MNESNHLRRVCLNCQYLFATPEVSHCNNLDIDILTDSNHKVYCNEFKLWWGAVE